MNTITVYLSSSGLPCGIRSHDERNQLGQPNELANGQNGKPEIIQFSLPFELITWHIEMNLPKSRSGVRKEENQ